MLRKQKIKKGYGKRLMLPDIWEPRINRFSCFKTFMLAVAIIIVVTVLIGCSNITVSKYVY